MYVTIDKRMKPVTGKPAWLAAWAIALAGLFIAFLSAGVLGAAPAAAQDDGSRVALNKDMTIAKGDVVEGDVSVTNGKLTLLGEVDGYVVVMQGDAYIDGKVKGDVTVTHGNIMLGPDSVIDGEVSALLGKVERDPKAQVHGQVNAPSLSVGGMSNNVVEAPQPSEPVNLPAAEQSSSVPATMYDHFISFFSKGMISMALLLMGLLLTAIAPRRVQVSSLTLEAEPIPSLIVGSILAVLLVPVVIIASFALLVSLIGVVFIPVLFVAVGVGLLFGLVAVSGWIGRAVYESSRQGQGSPTSHTVMEVLIGMAVLLGVTLLPSILLPGGVTVIMAGLVYFAACVGFGSSILSRFGVLVPPKHAHRIHHMNMARAIPAQPSQPSQPAQPTAYGVAQPPAPPPGQQPPAGVI